MTGARFDDLYAPIPHPTDRRILLLDGEHGWTLPSATVPLTPTDHRWRDTARVNRAIGAVLGTAVTTRECVYVSAFPAPGMHGDAVFVMESRDHNGDAPARAGGRWVSAAELDDTALANTAHRPALRRWLIDAASASVARLPWTEAGWFTEAVAWIDAQLRAHGLDASGPVEQVRSWFLSAILRVPTTVGDLYFKAAPPLYAHEPTVTQAVAARVPALAPRVLAIETERRWLLMEGIAGVKLNDPSVRGGYLTRWEGILRAFARFQRDDGTRSAPLLALGCPDWRLDVLATLIAPLLDEAPMLLRGVPDPLPDAELAGLRSHAPRLRSLCAELAATPIPASLHHGDFHSGNILVTDTACTLIDWAGFVGMTHPFLSLWVPLDEQADDGVRDRLREAYLREWSAYAPLDQLRAAATQALPLAALCGALGHRNQLVHAVTRLPWDIQGEQKNMLFCLRRMLEFMATA